MVSIRAQGFWRKLRRRYLVGRDLKSLDVSFSSPRVWIYLPIDFPKYVQLVGALFEFIADSSIPHPMVASFAQVSLYFCSVKRVSAYENKGDRL